MATINGKASRTIKFSDDDIAYLVDWRNDRATRLLSQLLRQDIVVQVAQKPFAVDSGGKRKDFGFGTLSIVLGVQNKGKPNQRTVNIIRRLLTSAANDGVDVTPVKTGLTPEGIDLGSGSFPVIRRPDVAMIIGSGISQYRTGEIWHTLDNDTRFPITLLKTEMVPGVDLSRYDKLIIAGPIDEFEAEVIGPWVKNGGTLIACGDSLGSVDRLLVQRELLNNPNSSQAESEHPHNHHLQRPFVDRRSEGALKQIAGAIFNTTIDPTHPLFYGIEGKNLPVFRTSTTVVTPSKTPHQNPAVYPENPLLAGYASDENVKKITGSASVVVEPLGRGQIIVLVDNPVFRGYFHGTKRVLLNSIFFGHLSGRRGR